MMLIDRHPVQAWSKLNKIYGGLGDIVSLVQSVSVHIRMSEDRGHTDQISLTFFNLIHPMTALSCPVSRSRSLLPVQSGDCSLKHTHSRTDCRLCYRTHTVSLLPRTANQSNSELHRRTDQRRNQLHTSNERTVKHSCSVWSTC